MPIMMFGNIVISGLQMIGSCGFSQRHITIAALSLSIGLGDEAKLFSNLRSDRIRFAGSKDFLGSAFFDY